MKTDVMQEAQGRWRGILQHYGISNDFLRKRHGPCPVCGGKDRFLFDDKEGRGTFYCNSCGAGTGAQLLSLFKGWSMSETMKHVGEVVGTVEKQDIRAEMTDDQKRKAMNDLWQSSVDPKQADPVGKYILSRCGTDVIPFSIRYHPTVYHAETQTRHPCMVAKVTGFDNRPVAIHRTYLTPDGKKASVEPNKKLMASMPDGSAVRLGPYTETIGIAEGIETALTCAVCFGVPTWAAVSAAMLVKWKPPENIEKVFIFADNDHSFTGQVAAYRLAWNLEREFKGKYKIRVVVPRASGADWNDVFSLLGRDATRAMLDL